MHSNDVCRENVSVVLFQSCITAPERIASPQQT